MRLCTGEQALVDGEGRRTPADVPQEEGVPGPIAPPAGILPPGGRGDPPGGVPHVRLQAQVGGELPVDDGVQFLSCHIDQPLAACWALRASMAAMRERTRIFTA